MRIPNEIINGDTTIEKIEEDQKQFKSKLKQITTGNPEHKSKNQIFMNQDKKLSIYLMIMLELNLKLCMKQNIEQDLKY